MVKAHKLLLWQWALPLLLVISRAWGQAASPSISAPGPLPRVLNVCTSPYWPLTTCGGGAQPGGYEVELFKRTAERLARNGNPQWAPGNWTWLCLDSWDELLEDLQKPAGICDVVVAGLSATAERKAQGIQFSYATLGAGLRIMIHIDDSRGMWSFLDPFEPSLWVACFGTSALVGLLLLLSESPLSQLWSSPQPALARAAGMQWGALTTFLRMASQLSPRSTGGRLILAGYGFLVYIMANLYISSMSAILATRSTRSSFEHMEDLVNVPIGVFIDDKAAFERFALNDAYYLPWATNDDEAAMMNMLRSGVIKALVLDSPWVKYTTASYCDLFNVGDIVLPVDLGFAFPNATSPETLAAFDSALSYLDDTGVMVTLERQYLLPQNPCHSGREDPGQLLSNPQVKLKHVSGLWVFLGGCVALCVFWNAGLWLWRMRQARAAEAQRVNAGMGKKTSGAPPGNASHSNLSSSLYGPNEPPLLGTAATQDEALQALDLQLQHMDNLIRHLPFVMVASMDTRLSDLKAQLAATLAPRQSNSTTHQRSNPSTEHSAPGISGSQQHHQHSGGQQQQQHHSGGQQQQAQQRSAQQEGTAAAPVPAVMVMTDPKQQEQQRQAAPSSRTSGPEATANAGIGMAGAGEGWPPKPVSAAVAAGGMGSGKSPLSARGLPILANGGSTNLLASPKVADSSAADEV